MQDAYRTEQMNGSDIGTFMVGMLCGAAVGAALGLMFAPKSGAEMRHQLADQTERLRQRASDQADRLRQRASDAYTGASQTINDVVARGREALDVGRETFQKARPNGASGATRSSMP
jgi:gas vesicle protein